MWVVVVVVCVCDGGGGASVIPTASPALQKIVQSLANKLGVSMNIRSQVQRGTCF